MGGSCEGGKVSHTRKPLCWQRLRVAEGGALEPWGRAQKQGCGGQSREIPAQRSGADQHSPDREACLLTRQDGWGLGDEARASVGSQGEDCGWLRKHSLTGASAPRLAGRESRKKSGAAEQARDFFLPLSYLVRKERGLRALLKGAPEMGASHGYQCEPQRRACDTKAAAAPPRSLCASTGHYPHPPSQEPVQPTTASVP